MFPICFFLPVEFVQSHPIGTKNTAGRLSCRVFVCCKQFGILNSQEVSNALCASALCAVRALRTKVLSFQRQNRVRRRHISLVAPRPCEGAAELGERKVTESNLVDEAFEVQQDLKKNKH